jgi:hypothetical protein
MCPAPVLEDQTVHGARCAPARAGIMTPWSMAVLFFGLDVEIPATHELKNFTLKRAGLGEDVPSIVRKATEGAVCVAGPTSGLGSSGRHLEILR